MNLILSTRCIFDISNSLDGYKKQQPGDRDPKKDILTSTCILERANVTFFLSAG